MNFQFPQKAGHFLTSCETISFSKTNVHRVIRIKLYRQDPTIIVPKHSM
jgi:cyclophilin family peptidyl-prolyl cis-trans isomerase